MSESGADIAALTAASLGRISCTASVSTLSLRAFVAHANDAPFSEVVSAPKCCGPIFWCVIELRFFLVSVAGEAAGALTVNLSGSFSG